MASPNLASNCGHESTNAIRISTTAKYLNDTAHRHSFNESIYSEAYGGRLTASNNRRFETNLNNHPNPLSESASATNISANKGISANRNYPANFFTHRDLYGTIESIASNGISTEQSNSTRSSIYSDKTILNEQISSPTPSFACANDESINKYFASNATGSRISLQTNYNQIESKNSTTLLQAKQSNEAVILSPDSNSESFDQSMT